MRTLLCALLLILLCGLALAAKEVHIPSDSISRLTVLNMRGDSIALASQSGGGRTFMIFYNALSCRDCFFQLMDALGTVAADTGDRWSVLLRSEHTVLARRAVIQEAREIFADMKSFYFDTKPEQVRDPWPPVGLQGGLFGGFGVSRTPALLIIEHTGERRELFIPYERLFPAHIADDPVAHLVATIRARLRPEVKAAVGD